MSGRKINGIPIEMWNKMNGVTEILPKPVFTEILQPQPHQIKNVSQFRDEPRHDDIEEDEEDGDSILEDLVKELNDLKKYALFKVRFGECDMPKLLELIKMKSDNFIRDFVEVLKMK